MLVIDQMSQFCELGALMLFKGFSTDLKMHHCCDIKDSPITYSVSNRRVCTKSKHTNLLKVQKSFRKGFLHIVLTLGENV